MQSGSTRFVLAIKHGKLNDNCTPRNAVGKICTTGDSYFGFAAWRNYSKQYKERVHHNRAHKDLQENTRLFSASRLTVSCSDDSLHEQLYLAEILTTSDGLKLEFNIVFFHEAANIIYSWQQPHVWDSDQWFPFQLISHMMHIVEYFCFRCTPLYFT